MYELKTQELRLVRETLPQAGTPYVKLIAVMTRYNPFAERAGMTKIAESRPDPKLIRVAEALTIQGFNIHLLGSRRYLRTKLMTLTQEELMRVKQAISTGISHPKLLKKLTRREIIFGHKKEGLIYLKEADTEKLVELIYTLGILPQTKTYLFWEKKP